jgi:hypothetical protein
MPLSNLPGPWRWEKRNGKWWRIHDGLNIEDGPHTLDDDVVRLLQIQEQERS